MNTQNTFLRFSKENDLQEGKLDGHEMFFSIGDILYSGTPIDEDGDDMGDDGLLYRMVSPNKYEKIA